MKKIDIIISIIITELTVLYFVLLFKDVRGIWILFIISPFLAAFGIWLAYLIGKKFLFVFQLVKFLLIGIAAALVDLGILNLIILISGISIGFAFSIFKTISFIIAFSAKFLGDKLWAFEKKEVIGTGIEFSKFFGVTLIGLLINVVVASLVVNLIGPQFGLSKQIWANIAGIIGALATVVWNFPAYKYLVFKK
jgi:putative flippase GtrA